MMKKEFENGRAVLAALFAVCVASAAIPQSLQAQATILTACYVPDVGVVYRIKETGLPGACTETTHVEFTWNVEGPAGPQGAPGPQGAAGISGLEFVTVSVTHTVDISEGLIEGQATCPSGKSVIGGSSVITAPVSGDISSSMAFIGDFKVSGIQAWKAVFLRRNTGTRSFDVTAICANVA